MQAVQDRAVGREVDAVVIRGDGLEVQIGGVAGGVVLIDVEIERGPRGKRGAGGQIDDKRRRGDTDGVLAGLDEFGLVYLD